MATSPVTVGCTPLEVVDKTCNKKRVRLQNVGSCDILLKIHKGIEISTSNYEISLADGEAVILCTSCSVWAIVAEGTGKLAVLVQDVAAPYYG